MSYSVVFSVDEAKKRIHVKISGVVDSARYVDDCIAFFRSLDAPWLYQRFIDFRDSTGAIAYADIIRLEQYWASTPQASHPVRTAAVVRTESEMFRNQSMKLIFESHPVIGFLDEAEALAWLDEAR